MKNEKIDEALELLWMIMEEGNSKNVEISTLPDHTGCFDPELIEKVGKRDIAAAVHEAEKAGYLSIENGKAGYTPFGEGRARDIIRRHRLAERLLSDALALPESEIEPGACKFEHILTEGVTDSVCSFLGHPPMCPHNKPIPRGKCCERFSTEIQPLVIRLKDADVGVFYKIIFMSSKNTHRLQKISGLGLVPGSNIKILQRKPSFVVQTGETMLAIDDEIVDEIYVKNEAGK